MTKTYYQKLVEKIEAVYDFVRDNHEQIRAKYGNNPIITSDGIFKREERRLIPKDSIMLGTSLDSIVSQKKWVLNLGAMG